MVVLRTCMDICVQSTSLLNPVLQLEQKQQLQRSFLSVTLTLKMGKGFP